MEIFFCQIENRQKTRTSLSAYGFWSKCDRFQFGLFHWFQCAVKPAYTFQNNSKVVENNRIQPNKKNMWSWNIYLDLDAFISLASSSCTTSHPDLFVFVQFHVCPPPPPPPPPPHLDVFCIFNEEPDMNVRGATDSDVCFFSHSDPGKNFRKNIWPVSAGLKSASGPWCAVESERHISACAAANELFK